MPVYQLIKEPVFPSPTEAEQDGLLAIGGDLLPERLLQAYANGIFPWYSEGDPILWWSPDPRMVLFPNEFKVSKSLRQTIRNKGFEVKFDNNFSAVIESCRKTVRKDEPGTWITEEMQRAYQELHRLGFAHSVEVYFENKLVGGLYGVSIGAAFFGESMFHLESDASKVALFHLVEKAKAWDFHFIDAQLETDHLKSMGAKAIAREDFLKLLEKSNSVDTKRGKW